jgi:VWFA-related protein
MCSMRSVRVVLLLGCLLLPLAAQAQFQEQISVEVVDVPVYVFGPQGPLTNLTRDDFDLFVNGKRQNIDYFDRIDFTLQPAPSGVEASQPVVPRDPRNRRLFLLLFDFSSGNPHAIVRARDGAMAMIRDALPSDYFSVATYSALKGVEFVTPFIVDRDATRRAVTTLRPSEAHDPLELAISNPERLLLEQNAGDHGAQLPESRHPQEDSLPTELQKMVDGEKQLMKMPGFRLFEDELRDFTLLGSRLAQLDGFKHVLFLSTGFPVALGDPQLYRKYEDMQRAFLASNAMIDTVDLTVNDPFSKDMHFGSEGLHGLARDSGGQHIHNENPVDKALARVTTSTMTGYRIGFKMPANAKRGANSIDVKVRDLPKGSTVSFRRGFSGTAPAARSLDALRLSDIVLNDIPQTGIAPAITFRERPFLDVDVPAKALIGSDAVVLLYVFDAKGVVVDFKQKRVTSAGIFRTKLDLPPGAYVAKALLRIGSPESIGLARTAFVIPELKDGGGSTSR